jgi:hypothetical protein
MTWKKYQEDTAEIFRSIGWESEIEKDVEGARGTHEIDVFVTFQQHGIGCQWVVECKYWNSSVPKEKVLALQSIVDDIGADKGVLVSKKGFQSGAIKQAQKSNIFLTSLDELRELVEEKILSYKAENLERELVGLHLKYQKLVNPAYSKNSEYLQYGFLEYGINGMEGQKVIVLDWLLNEIKKDVDFNKIQSDTYKIYLCDENTDFKMNSKIETKAISDHAEYLNNIETIIMLSSKWLQEKKVPFECT